ncbi:MAG TPA: TolC family protein, partial [Limnobacter sp.]|nr:TolC family protein [Limnobacter sp.]
LYAFGRIDAGISAAEHRVNAATVAVDESKVDLVDRVLQAFFDVNKTRELVDVQQQFVVQHRDLRDTVQRRFDGEVASQSDLLLAQTRLDQTENQLAVYVSQHEKAVATLRSLIKVNSVSFRAPEALSPKVGSEEELQQLASSFSPLIKRLTAEQVALEHDARVAVAATKPQLVLRAERVESNVPSQFADNRLITALQYQPGAGLSAGSIAAAAQSRALAAELDIQAAQLELTERCATLYNDMQINLSQEKNLAKVLDSNQEFFESMLRQFQAGKRSWLDVLNSVRETNQAATALVIARNDAQLNIRRVHNLAGLFYQTTVK